MNYRGTFAAFALLTVFSLPLCAATIDFKGYNFEASVLQSSGKRYREFADNKQTLLKVRANEEYSIIVRNPLPVRVAVAVSIDGLNSIDGKRTSPRSAKKWIIAPNSSITVSGWQTSKQTLRKFLFTEQTASLAQWQENKEGKPYTRNLGVIGAAWFWNQNELEDALRPPQPFVEDSAPAAESGSRNKSSAAPSARAERSAGTGMGRQQQNRVTEVAFDANAGMFSVKDVMKIYYEFAQNPAEPLPFVDDEEDQGRFTPDMRK